MASLESNDEATILIHGAAWKVNDVKEAALWCMSQTWHKQNWVRLPALVHKVGGTTSQYIGQKYDPEKIAFVDDGCLRHFWHVACGAGFGAKSKWEQLIGDVGQQKYCPRDARVISLRP